MSKYRRKRCVDVVVKDHVQADFRREGEDVVEGRLTGGAAFPAKFEETNSGCRVAAASFGAK